MDSDVSVFVGQGVAQTMYTPAVLEQLACDPNPGFFGRFEIGYPLDPFTFTGQVCVKI